MMTLTEGAILDFAGGRAKLVRKYGRQRDANTPLDLVVSGEWHPSLGDLIERHGITSLVFNCSLGWRDEDFDFLKYLESIEELDILGVQAKNLQAIEHMTNLLRLNLDIRTSSRVNFAVLPRLEYVYLEWSKGFDSIFASRSLRRLGVNHLDDASFQRVSSLQGLANLKVMNSRISSIASLTRLSSSLEELYLYYIRGLSDFSPISGLTKLRRLALSNFKNLTDLTPLSSLLRLEVLDLAEAGKISSLSPLSELVRLKAISFPGRDTQIVDGDLLPLTRLPRLAMLMFQPRQHYSHRLIKPWNWNNLDSPDTLLEPSAGTRRAIVKSSDH